jgi:hypothetical protein
MLPDGTVVQNYSGWLHYQYSLMVMQNPRLVEESRKGTTLFVLDEARTPGGRDVLETRGPAIDELAAPDSRSLPPSGN